MLMHKAQQKLVFKRMIFATILTFTVTIAISAFSIGNWINEVGPNHVDSMYTVALYSKVSAYENDLIVPDTYNEYKPVVVYESPNFTKKVTAVRSFLNSYNAPIAKNAEDFVRAAEMYGIDYRLLPAISIIESGGGKKVFKPYNPFGWGTRGYKSFTSAIYDVSRGMSVYYSKGLVQPEQIAQKYNPVTPTQWAYKARFLMNKMPKL